MIEKDWLTFYGRDSSPIRFSFAGIEDQAEQIGRKLLTLGLIAQDRVIVCLPNSPYAVSVYQACIELNLIAVPLSPHCSKTELDFSARNCNAKAVITVSGSQRLSTYETDAKHLSHDELQTIIYTSGTTGQQKGVCLSRQQWLHNATMLNQHHGVSATTRHASPLPLYHVNAHGFSMIGTRLAQCPWIMFDHVDKHLLDVINAEQVDIVSLVPALIARLMEQYPKWRPHANLKYIVSAAAPLPSSLLKAVLQNWGVRILQGYGLSESTNFSCTMPTNVSADMYQEIMFPHPSIGIALPDVSIAIGDHDEEGKIGELRISSPSNCLGYWGRDNQSQSWIRTGDLGYFRYFDNQRFYYLTGRIKEIINRGGETISPLSIEEELRENGMRGEFAIVSIPDAKLGEEIGLICTEPFDENTLAQLAWHRRPKRWTVAPLPKTSTGKVRRSLASELLL